MENMVRIDSIEDYNKMYGFETLHPLVTVIDMNETTARFPLEVSYSYGVYAIFLKQTYCGDITYGRQPYDYQEGTITSFAPGQVVHVRHAEGFKPDARGVLFHPDLISGTSLGREIKSYGFFSYSSNEALHLSEREKVIFLDCLEKIRIELERPIDRHTKTLVCKNIELLLDYCMRFYDRQFITRENVNHDVLVRFESLLDGYFKSRNPIEHGLPSVKYFAENCYLSPNYFGDLVKKETGRTPQEIIQNKILDMAKNELLGTNSTIGDISYRLGFQYSQHFNRFFKKGAGMTPSEYRMLNVN
ncbi:helix-turn-helix domain-containing protein [Xylanibacter muris]|uniref:Helix-turn-helix transcriptional regulator n=1 Tax=Xylanibacter muris TaxID=2736290 RepID=A0ABX2AJL3_9BACT|nr:AraC family transcriptional regulator [Xylanibacter muris]NPD91326.1 helix-turn-helix transcriptional regulator [Xylanibacter muris]